MARPAITYTDLDFFPNCCIPSCQQFIDGITHQHIFPKQQQILDSITKYLYCQGGVGSGKTIAFAAKAVKMSLTIPENRGVVSRLNYDELFDSCWRDIKSCIRRLVDRDIIPAPEYSKKVQGDYTQINFHNGSEIKAIQGKNWNRGLGSSHGWFWVEDAMESQEEFFTGNETSAGLLSRLRLLPVWYDQKTYKVGVREHGSLHGMVSTNPPPIGHYLHKLFGNKPGLHKLGDDTVEWIQTITPDNLSAGANYAKGLIAVQAKMGHNKNTVSRIIYGESTPAYGGIPVFPTFQHERHVADIVYKPTLPLVRGWDFGFHHPAVVFSNLYKCNKGTNHYFTLSEIADCFSADVWELYKLVKDHTDTLYKNCCLILDGGDRSGYRHSSSNKDKRSDMRVLMADYKIPFRWRYLDIQSSLQYMRGLLKDKCACGLEQILISNQCPVLIGALEGGYKFVKHRNSPVQDKPTEDKYFADIACAWRYGAENFVRWGVPFSDRSTLPKQTTQWSPFKTQTPWGWMEMSDREMGQVIVR